MRTHFQTLMDFGFEDIYSDSKFLKKSMTECMPYFIAGELAEEHQKTMSMYSTAMLGENPGEDLGSLVEEDKILNLLNSFPSVWLEVPSVCRFEEISNNESIDIYAILRDKTGCYILTQKDGKYLFENALQTQQMEVLSTIYLMAFAKTFDDANCAEESITLKKFGSAKTLKKFGHTQIRNIVVIGKKREYDYSGAHNPDFEYSHRFRVRGHWRNCKGIGKDENDNYCVIGKTWVKDGIKGPDDKQLVEKIRVVNAPKAIPTII